MGLIGHSPQLKFSQEIHNYVWAVQLVGRSIIFVKFTNAYYLALFKNDFLFVFPFDHLKRMPISLNPKNTYDMTDSKEMPNVYMRYVHVKKVDHLIL